LLRKNPKVRQDVSPDFHVLTNEVSSEDPQLEDEIASIQSTLDCGGPFANNVISEAYEAFQETYTTEADELLNAWHTINILGTEASLSQRGITFRKIRDQFQKLVRTFYTACFACLRILLGGRLLKGLWARLRWDSRWGGNTPGPTIRQHHHNTTN
jgi:hypothetical protein